MTFQFQITVRAIQKPSSLAKTASVYRNYGCAILTTIAVMTVTSRHSCVVNVIAQLAGNVVQVTPIIDAYPNGYSATAKMTVAIVQTSDPKAVPNAIQTLSSSARTTDACQSNGCVTLPMIAATVRTRLRQLVPEGIGSVPKANSSVLTASVLPRDGDVITKMIVAIEVTKSTVMNSSARFVIRANFF